ncbi:MAG: hypothetical protein ACO3PB_08735 [Miltoncostaeaceae bacterium]
MLIRQGDLMMRRVGDPTTTDHPTKPATLAIGEESGHSHVLDGLVAVALDNAPRGVVDVPAETLLRVEGMPWRHDPIPVAPGRYEYWIQRELSEADEIRRVVD